MQTRHGATTFIGQGDRDALRLDEHGAVIDGSQDFDLFLDFAVLGRHGMFFAGGLLMIVIERQSRDGYERWFWVAECWKRGGWRLLCLSGSGSCSSAARAAQIVL
jgi:hypothetical protein